jgi:hypothetical protein|tara:strand:- start:1026 stop:1643 length:618 start_codon:yes stop_codon:yes gene_type:complete
METQIVNEFHDFIGIFQNAVDPRFCDFLVNYMDKAEFVDFKRNFSHVKDKQICLDGFSPSECSQMMKYVNNCLFHYINEYTYLGNFSYVSSLCLLQKTEPTNGYHLFHAENVNWNLNNRTMAWMVYLNDVEEGGETEFLYQKRKVKPTKGTILIWPGGYTHLHRGNPPMTDKYIATGWYQGNIGLQQVNTAGCLDQQYNESLNAE